MENAKGKATKGASNHIEGAKCEKLQLGVLREKPGSN